MITKNEENRDEIEGNVLRMILQKPIFLKPIYGILMESASGGIVLTQLIEWLNKSKNNKIACTDDFLIEETLVNSKELQEAKQKLKTLYFFKIYLEDPPNSYEFEIPTRRTCYEVDYDLLEIAIYEARTIQQEMN